MLKTMRSSSLRTKLARNFLLALTFPLLAAAQQQVKVAHRWVLGGEASWDYMTFDGATNRLFIAQSNPSGCHCSRLRSTAWGYPWAYPLPRHRHSAGTGRPAL